MISETSQICILTFNTFQMAQQAPSRVQKDYSWTVDILLLFAIWASHYVILLLSSWYTFYLLVKRLINNRFRYIIPTIQSKLCWFYGQYFNSKKHTLRTCTLFRSPTTVCRCCHCPSSTRRQPQCTCQCSSHEQFSLFTAPLCCLYLLHVCLTSTQISKMWHQDSTVGTYSARAKGTTNIWMSGDTHPMTQHHFPRDFKSSVKNFAAQVCVAAGTSVCTFHPLPRMTAGCKVYIWSGI
jgi:hypothetical protein